MQVRLGRLKRLSVSIVCADVMPDFENVISFHIVLDGDCWAQLEGDKESAVR